MPTFEVAAGSQSDSQSVIIQQRVPKKIIHFSDGVLEEFSSDEDADNASAAGSSATSSHESTAVAIDESKMAWMPWLYLKAGHTGSAVLEKCDYAGEAIASFLGITSPKYSYEIEAFQRMQKEREALDREDAEAACWTAGDQQPGQPITATPAVAEAAGNEAPRY